LPGLGGSAQVARWTTAARNHFPRLAGKPGRGPAGEPQGDRGACGCARGPRASITGPAGRAGGLAPPPAGRATPARPPPPPPRHALRGSIRKSPGGAAGYRERGNWFGQAGLWKKACEDLTQANRLEPEVTTSLKLGIVLAHLGDRASYQAHAQGMADRWSNIAS